MDTCQYMRKNMGNTLFMATEQGASVFTQTFYRLLGNITGNITHGLSHLILTKIGKMLRKNRLQANIIMEKSARKRIVLTIFSIFNEITYKPKNR